MSRDEWWVGRTKLCAELRPIAKAIKERTVSRYTHSKETGVPGTLCVAVDRERIVNCTWCKRSMYYLGKHKAYEQCLRGATTACCGSPDCVEARLQQGRKPRQSIYAPASQAWQQFCFGA